MAGSFGLFGISLRGGGTYSMGNHILFGAYLGLFVTILVTGRHFYGHVLHRAAGRPTTDSVPGYCVWGARGCVLALAVFLSLLALTGLDWLHILLFTSFTLINFTVMSRLLAEAGLFSNAPMWSPAAIILSLAGIRLVGPMPMLLLGTLSYILVMPTREAMMPNVVNALRILQLRRVSPGRAAIWCVITLMVSLCVAIPVTFFWQYKGGTEYINTWSLRQPAQQPMQEALKVHQRLQAQGIHELSPDDSSWQQLAMLSPSGPHLVAIIAGFGLVLTFAYARLRFRNWPIHPILFATWTAAFPLNQVGFAWIYYALSGDIPKRYSIFG